jgi:hypothetical protein
MPSKSPGGAGGDELLGDAVAVGRLDAEGTGVGGVVARLLRTAHTSYCSNTGDEDAARRIRIARNRDELSHLKAIDARRSRTYRMRRRPFGRLLGYGYQRHRAGWLLVATVLLAGWLFRQADNDWYHLHDDYDET